MAEEKNKYSMDYLAVASAAFLIVGLLAGMFIFPQGGTQGGGQGTPVPSGFVTVSKEVASGKFASFVNTNFLSSQGSKMTITKTADGNSFFYVVDFEVSDGKGASQPGTFWLTQDGRYAIPASSALDLQTPVEAPADNGQGNTGGLVKSDKPVADVFVFSYCPYGLQFEKGLFSVIDTLKDKATITVRHIGAMHGMHEELEAKRQLCLREEQPATLYKYMSAFAANADISACQDKFYGEFAGDEAKMEVCVAPFISKMLADAGVDSAKFETCMKDKAQGYYDSDVAYASSKSVTGSPGLLINGTVVQSGRDSESIKKAICSAFNTAPAECSTALSSTAPSAGFGGGTGSSSTAGCGA